MKNFLYSLILLFLLTNIVYAETDSWVQISFGKTHIFKDYSTQPGEFGLGLILPAFHKAPLINLHPLLGFEVNFKRSYYIFSSLLFDFNIDPHFKVAITLGLGWYLHGSIDPIDLGFPLEFRESIEFIVLLFDQKLRLSFGIDHLSNASLGKFPNGGINNPGTESFYFAIGLPLNN